MKPAMVLPRSLSVVDLLKDLDRRISSKIHSAPAIRFAAASENRVGRGSWRQIQNLGFGIRQLGGQCHDL